MSTKIMPVTDLRRNTSAVIRNLHEKGDVVYITQHGRPAAVLIDYERYEALLEKARQQATWPPGYFEETYGALATDPVARPEQGTYETREDLKRRRN